MEFYVSMAMAVEETVTWDMTSCSEINIYQRFVGTAWFSHNSFFTGSRGSKFLWNCSRCVPLYTNRRY